MTTRKERTYLGLIRLHALAKGPGNLFSADRIASNTGIHRRSTHNDLQALVDEGKVRSVRGDGKMFYGADSYC